GLNSVQQWGDFCHAPLLFTNPEDTSSNRLQIEFNVNRVRDGWRTTVYRGGSRENTNCGSSNCEFPFHLIPNQYRPRLPASLFNLIPRVLRGSGVHEKDDFPVLHGSSESSLRSREPEFIFKIRVLCLFSARSFLLLANSGHQVVPRMLRCQLFIRKHSERNA
ncbi:hypothetical protein AVEN_117528-1, partial [Araneus ventricosus]